ncbi:siderophore-interacting protein [Pseudonocardia halophobica]|uniref:Siderophore-interacting protein n=1 Tax=Pseudonocardia halophobica TaxID=29401 RepID=A0A9W6L0R0_9PSEU|nr:siderophore-interacting protein [Pseudonocardia halophobica]GLL10025.1 siderophore-interacting protein [Pseudonocardia halophobica]
MTRSFDTSPNVLFDTRVAGVDRLSPGFVRLTLHGPQLAHFVAHGPDQRIKLLVPQGDYPAAFGPRTEPLPERDWRAIWRSLPDAGRPALRSYTPTAVRWAQREIDVDVFVHARPGPASRWAGAARPGERLLVSGPDVRRGRPGHGVQWQPGAATSVLVAADEAALPALRGILASLGAGVGGTTLVEVGDPADAAGLPAPPGVVTTLCARGGLLAAVEEWVSVRGAAAAALGGEFYAWAATESSRVARVRTLLAGAGIAANRIHTQGYWHDRRRAG